MLDLENHSKPGSTDQNQLIICQLVNTRARLQKNSFHTFMEGQAHPELKALNNMFIIRKRHNALDQSQCRLE